MAISVSITISYGRLARGGHACILGHLRTIFHMSKYRSSLNSNDVLTSKACEYCYYVMPADTVIVLPANTAIACERCYASKYCTAVPMFQRSCETEIHI